MDTLPPYFEFPHSESGVGGHVVDQKPPVRSLFYFAEGNIVFKVENTFFKLWDAPFRRYSHRFCAEQGLPTLEDALDGAEEAVDHPYKDEGSALELSGISAVDFEQLLYILFPPVIGEYRPKNWVPVLHLSTLWGFPSIRTLALTHLARMDIDPIERLILAYNYRIALHWATPAYVALCARPMPLNATEIAKIGTSATAHITTARERLGARRTNLPTVRRVVEEVLGFADNKPADENPMQNALDGIGAGAVAVGEGVRKAFGGFTGLFGGNAGLAPELAAQALPAVSGTSTGFSRADGVGAADQGHRDNVPTWQ